MAPNLARSTLDFIHDMLISGELTTSQMAEAAGCSKRAIIVLLEIGVTTYTLSMFPEP